MLVKDILNNPEKSKVKEWRDLPGKYQQKEV